MDPLPPRGRLTALWAQADPTVLDWASYGALGLVVLGFISGLIWAKPAVQKLIEDLDKARADLRRLEELDREVLLPALARSTELMQRFIEEQRHMRRRPDDDDPPSGRR